jgi:hypothetical protein
MRKCNDVLPGEVRRKAQRSSERKDRRSLVTVTASGEAPADAVATLDRKSGRLSLGLVNYSPSYEVALSLKAAGGTLPRTGYAWRIHGPNLAAINVPGQAVAVTTEPLPAIDLGAPMRLPAHSITVLKGGK